MIIELVAEGIHGNNLSIPYDSGKHTYNLLVGYTVLLVHAMVTAYYVIVLPYLQDSVKHVLTVLTLIKRSIILLKPAIGSLNYHNVAILAKQGHHTGAYVGMDYLTVFLKLFLIG